MEGAGLYPLEVLMGLSGVTVSRLIHQSVELQAALLFRLQCLLLVYIYIIIFTNFFMMRWYVCIFCRYIRDALEGTPLIFHIEDDLIIRRSAVHFVKEVNKIKKNDWSEHLRTKTSDCHITIGVVYTGDAVHTRPVTLLNNQFWKSKMCTKKCEPTIEIKFIFCQFLF